MTGLSKGTTGPSAARPRASALCLVGAVLTLLLTGCAPNINLSSNLLRDINNPYAFQLDAEIIPNQTNIRKVTVEYRPGGGQAPVPVEAVPVGNRMWRATIDRHVQWFHPSLNRDFRVDYHWIVTYRTAGVTEKTTAGGTFWSFQSPRVALLSPRDRAVGVGTPNVERNTVSVNLSWEPFQTAHGYRLTYFTIGEDSTRGGPHVVQSKEPRFTIPQLAPGARYGWYVEAEFDNADEPPRAPGIPHIKATGLKSAEWTFETGYTRRVPAPPSNLQAVARGVGQIDLSWENNSTDATSIIVERSTTGLAGSFAFHAEIEGRATAASDKNTPENPADLLPNTRYYYRLRARNANGLSDYSNVASATTAAAPNTPPGAPRNLTATATSPTNVLLRWENTSDNSGYVIERADGPGAAFAVVGEGPQGNVVGLNDDSVAAGTAYKYRIMAFNLGAGGRLLSPYSNEASVTTPAGEAGRTATQFVNTSSYPIVSLVVNGVERCGSEASAILPGGALELAMPAGTYFLTAKNGFWSNGVRNEMYSFARMFTQRPGVVGRETFPNPTIEQLLTRFNVAGTGYWVGEYWRDTTINSRAFRFDSRGNYTEFDNGTAVRQGRFSLVRYPGNFIVTFMVTPAQGESFEGILDERTGTFMMSNGPAGWRTIQYSYDGT